MFDAKSWQLGKDGSPHGERRMKMITRYYYIAFYIVLMLGILIGVFAQRVMQ
jgi:hypothetical protein